MDPFAPFRADPGRSGVFLDFDGTLAEIADLPADARPVAGAVEALGRLAARLAVVAIVSGRAAPELVEWLGPRVAIWGLHGAERAEGGRVVVAERARPFAELMARVRAEAAAEVEDSGLAGLVVEDKGVMVGLHYRTARDRERARRYLADLAADLAARHDLAVAEAKLVFELRPPVEFSKAQVVLEAGAGLGAVAFVGDDLIDVPAFDALDELERQGAAVVRVAVASDEAPAELVERADVVVDGPRGVVEMLRSIVADD